MRSLLGIILALICACSVLPSTSFATQRASLNVVLRTFYGAVKEIDSEKSALLLETDEGDFEFLVPPQARIFRGADRVPFSDIQKEDEATIKYYEDEQGRKLVLSIVLEG